MDYKKGVSTTITSVYMVVGYRHRGGPEMDLQDVFGLCLEGFTVESERGSGVQAKRVRGMRPLLLVVGEFKSMNSYSIRCLGDLQGRL